MSTRYSAVRPDERFQFIASDTNFSVVAANDASVKAFGMHQIDRVPMAVAAKLLPIPELRYAGEKVSYSNQ